MIMISLTKAEAEMLLISQQRQIGQVAREMDRHARQTGNNPDPEYQRTLSGIMEMSTTVYQKLYIALSRPAVMIGEGGKR